MIAPVACPDCRGSGELRRHVVHRVTPHGRNGVKLLPIRCPRCGGSGDLEPRRLHFAAARRCASCARPFSPPVTAPGLAAQLCSWCLRDLVGKACRICGADVERLPGRGRPAAFCPAHIPHPRRYALVRARRGVAGRTELSGRDLDVPPGSQEGGGSDGDAGQERTAGGEGDGARGDATPRSGDEEVAQGRPVERGRWHDDSPVGYRHIGFVRDTPASR